MRFWKMTKILFTQKLERPTIFYNNLQYFHNNKIKT